MDPSSFLLFEEKGTFNESCPEIFPYPSTNARNAFHKMLNVPSFLGSVHPRFLVTNKLESSLQELIISEDNCYVIFIVVVSMFHGDILMKIQQSLAVVDVIGCC